MDLDDAAPPPIRRSSREALEVLKTLEKMQLGDDDYDEAAPPPIARRRSASPSSSPAARSSARPATAPPVPNKSPLRAPEPTQRSVRRSRNFSHPFKEQFLTPLNAKRNSNPVPSRSPAKPISYRHNPRLPLSLRRRSSLETIESVTTSNSLPDEPTDEESERPSFDTSTTGFSIAEEEDDVSVRRSGPCAPSLTHSSDTSSERSASRPMYPNSPLKHSASSILRKMKPTKTQEPLLSPEHLEIERRVSLDQNSHRTSSASSVVTISSGRPSTIGYVSSGAGSQSQISKEWKSSNYDTSNLSEADLKKCKKKGINPALYAEMKAARKGKFGILGGNTIL